MHHHCTMKPPSGNGSVVPLSLGPVSISNYVPPLQGLLLQQLDAANEQHDEVGPDEPEWTAEMAAEARELRFEDTRLREQRVQLHIAAVRGSEAVRDAIAADLLVVQGDLLRVIARRDALLVEKIKSTRVTK